jgi:hypothetical protein
MPENNTVFAARNLFDGINQLKPLVLLALANGESATEADREALCDLTVAVEELHRILVDVDEPDEGERKA